jgi:hypothetical protein
MRSNTRSISMRAVRDGVFAVALAAVAGCATRQPSNLSPVLAPNALAASLNERDRLLTSLETPAIMDYSGPSGHLKAHEQLTVRRPSSLRVDVLSPLGVALIVAAEDAQIAVFNPSANTLLRGPANADTLARFTRIPLAPTEAVQLLLGLVPDDAILAAAPLSSRTEDNMIVLSYAGARKVSYELGFSHSQLALVRVRDETGQVRYEIRYSDYRDIGGTKFPFALEARFPASVTTVKLRYLDPLIDRQIADSMFVLSPGPNTRLIEFGFEHQSSISPAA